MIKRYSHTDTPQTQEEHTSTQPTIKRYSHTDTPQTQEEHTSTQTSEARVYAEPHRKQQSEAQRGSEQTDGNMLLFATNLPLRMLYAWSTMLYAAQSTNNELLKLNLQFASDLFHHNSQIFLSFFDLPRQITQGSLQVWQAYMKQSGKIR